MIDLMCAAPVDTIGFLSPVGYVLANDQCGVQIGSVAVDSDGLAAKTGMMVTRVDSDLDALASVQDQRWAVSDEDSLSNSLYFQAMLKEADVEVGEAVPVAGESVAMLAVGEEDVDVATAEFIPPILPFEETVWDGEDDDPEPWRALGLAPERSPIGYVRVNGDPQNGGYRVRDARSRIFDVAPQIFDETRIVALSAPIPNETVVYGRDFPLAMARQLEAELTGLRTWRPANYRSVPLTSMAGAGLVPAVDEMYEPVRFVRETLELDRG